MRRVSVAELRSKGQGGNIDVMRFTPLRVLALALISVSSIACRTGVPVVDTGQKPPNLDGTIAGHVSSTGGAAVVGRIVRAIAVEGGQKYEATTNNAGTYTIKVPPGHYRLEVELHSGEKLAKEPGGTKIDRSDLDPNRDFVIAPG
jgi:carboxypeptidase family protein